MLRIKRDDRVIVTVGKDKGKSGKILKVFTSSKKVVVENVNIFKKAVKKNDQYPAGGFIEIEKPINISNVMLIDSKTGKPTRFSSKLLKDGAKLRVVRKSGETI